MKIPSEIWLGLIILWGILTIFYRSRFRKMIYRTNDWERNFQYAFVKEIRGLFGNTYPYDKNYIRMRNIYRINVIILTLLICIYIFNQNA